MKNLLSLFSGIGSFERALDIVGVDYELSNYCEICKYQSKLYSTIHDVDENKNLWDIRNIDIGQLGKNIDVITHGSPCTSYSVMGKQEGGDEGSGTKSSLMWHTVEIVKNKRPEYVIWENVPNVATSKKHKHNFKKYLNDLGKLGYTNYWEILNSKNFDIPQSRKRVFVVSIRNDTDNNFEFPKGTPTDLKIKDFVDEINNRKVKSTLKKYFDSEYYLDYNSKNGCIKLFDGVSQGYFNGGYSHNRIWSEEGYSPTIITSEAINIGELKGKLTPLETWRLMGFKDEDYYKGKQALENTFYNGNDRSDTRMYKAAGNSIVVNVLVAIFKNLFKERV